MAILIDIIEEKIYYIFDIFSNDIYPILLY